MLCLVVSSLFSTIEVAGNYTYYLNLCDQESTLCGGDSALCQRDTTDGKNDFYSLGAQSTASISDVAGL